MKKFIIIGGNFQNTGAQAMTFVTVDALKKKYPDCDVIMFTSLRDIKKDNSNYTFRVVHIGSSAYDQANSSKKFLKIFFTGVAKILLKKGNHFKEYKILNQSLKNCDGVFDISGYALTSQFSNQYTLGRLSRIDLFDKHSIPFYFMPQSFGPFDYKENKDYMLSKLKETLPKASKIFVREKEGYQMLKELIGENNIVESYDMVLQSGDINKSNIYKKAPSVKEIDVSTKNNVAIIPNMRNFDHGNKEAILSLYEVAIKRLICMKKNIYLISHSAEDIEMCKLIKDKFQKDDNVKVITEKIDSWNFDSLIRQFDFAIASRFHSIVHSYRAEVPCIALGWATKYKELLETLDQERYLFDVRNLNDREHFISAIMKMNDQYEEEKKIIKKRLAEIQKSNCFNQLDF